MIQISSSELRERISDYLSLVEHGEEITIERHGKPIARLTKPTTPTTPETPIMQTLRQILERPRPNPTGQSLYGQAKPSPVESSPVESSQHVQDLEQSRDEWDQ
jgi:antitoxin (DNA-binding transcriptional repressor) of toxin-antitoxin stability system